MCVRFELPSFYLLCVFLTGTVMSSLMQGTRRQPKLKLPLASKSLLASTSEKGTVFRYW